MLSDLMYRLRSLTRRGVMEQELDSELRFHLDREVDKHVAAGATRAEAERRARLTFGGLDRIKDDTRDARGVNAAEHLMQDLRYAVRGLRARPGFSAAIVAALALGIGANAAMFGVVDRLLYRAPAYMAHPDRVGQVYLTATTSSKERTYAQFEYTRYLVFLRNIQSFDRAAVVGYRHLPVGVGEQTKEAQVGAVSATMFDFFDARPVLGRFFGASEDQTPSGSAVAVLGYDYWQSQYAGAASVLGSSIHIGNGIYTIVGVAPRGFVGFTEEAPPVAFIPVTAFAATRMANYYKTYNWSWLSMYAREKPGVSLAAADADLTHAFTSSWLDQPASTVPPVAVARPHAIVASVHSGRGPTAGPQARIALLVMGVALMVLLIACANVANLLLARAIARRREVALRLSLGVSRWRLLQQFAVESLVLAVASAVVGLFVAHWSSTVLTGLFARPGVPSGSVLDARTLTFAGTITLVVALTTGIAPALHAMRADLAGALRDGSLGGGRRRSRAATSLTLLQAALSVVLLVGAGLFLRSLSNLRELRLGYDADSIVFVGANMRGAKLSDTELAALDQRMLGTAQHAPGVENAALVISVPFWSFEGRGAPVVLGKDSLDKLGAFTMQTASPTYFATAGTRILRGRGFLPSDEANSMPIAVIGQTMAQAIWPGENAIGKQFRVGGDSTPLRTVVGIAEDLHGQRFTGDPEFWYYLPLSQAPEAAGQLFVRVRGNPADAVASLRKLLQPLMPGASYINATPLSDMVGQEQRPWSEGATMFAAFGVLALVLAALGLYSVVAYAVAQRTRELGVRLALGARAPEVARAVVGQALGLASIGIVAGSVLALAAGHWVTPLLFDESPRDPSVFLGVAAVLIIVAGAASLIPAMRAARVDPAHVLRMD